MMQALVLLVLVIVFLLYSAVTLYIGRLLVYNDVKKRRVPSAEKLDGYSYEEIEFENPDDGITLRGWFVKAQQNSESKGRTVVLLHGWRRDRLRLLGHIKLFVDCGFHVLAYDQRAHGASDTALITFGDGEARDLFSALSFLDTRPEVDPKRIGALGFSQGTGGIVYAVGRSEKRLFRAIVLEGVFGNSFEVGRYLLERKFGRINSLLIGYLIFTVGSQIMSFGKFRHSEPARFAGSISPTPLLIVRGTKDHMVSEENARAFIEAAGDPKELWEHDGHHTRALSNHPEDYREHVVGFLEKEL